MALLPCSRGGTAGSQVSAAHLFQPQMCGAQGCPDLCAHCCAQGVGADLAEVWEMHGAGALTQQMLSAASPSTQQCTAHPAGSTAWIGQNLGPGALSKDGDGDVQLGEILFHFAVSLKAKLTGAFIAQFQFCNESTMQMESPTAPCTCCWSPMDGDISSSVSPFPLCIQPCSPHSLRSPPKGLCMQMAPCQSCQSEWSSSAFSTDKTAPSCVCPSAIKRPTKQHSNNPG